MPYKENLKKATLLKEELDSFRPLTPEIEQRIMQKFRLDWNYHSSHIEGNQLTYGETKALILFGTTAQAKPLKDHIEMNGHNEAILNIEEIIRQGRPLTESFIRELHQIILKEPYEVNAITPDGQPTKKRISIGQYKTTPNHVKTNTGEIFYFATPEETPAKMEELMVWYNENKDNKDIHSILFATEFHYRFIRIHPFDDGNGRIARLIMNFLLLGKGYPPAIIKTEEKGDYFATLQLADSGQLEYFFNYVCIQVIHSLELMLKGARGESIEDEDDLDKKLVLLRQEVESEDVENEIKARLTINLVQHALTSWGISLFAEIGKTSLKFNEFYESHKILINILLDNRNYNYELGNDLEFEKLNDAFRQPDKEKQISSANFKLQSQYGAYRKGGLNPFGCLFPLEIKFEEYNYEVWVGFFDPNNKGQNSKLFVKKLLHKSLSLEEIKQINKHWGDTLFNHLEYHRKQLKNNDYK
ncbi:MAG: Fic family protein [Bacteroidales bacterium]